MCFDTVYIAESTIFVPCHDMTTNFFILKQQLESFTTKHLFTIRGMKNIITFQLKPDHTEKVS